MRLRLLCLGSSESDLDVQTLPAVVGRSLPADVVISDRDLSRRHCLLEDRDGELFVKDLESSSGTYVNGARIAERSVISGDVLTVGASSFCIRITGRRRTAWAAGQRSPGWLRPLPSRERPGGPLAANR